MALVYSCCFWFSLRLGGILIAIFSIFQGLVVLVACCVAYSSVTNVKERTTELINSMDLIYTKTYFENFQEDPEKYLSIGICFTCIYLFICLLYAYGAYMLKTMFMIGYILVELLRLISLAFGITAWLMVLKENTMDIGIRIGTSVAAFFILLGMFYLWVCAANLPFLINEMERDQQAATIHKLQQMLKALNSTSTQGLNPMNVSAMGMDVNSHSEPVLIATSFQRNKILKTMLGQDSEHFYSSRFKH